MIKPVKSNIKRILSLVFAVTALQMGVIISSPHNFTASANATVCQSSGGTWSNVDGGICISCPDGKKTSSDNKSCVPDSSYRYSAPDIIKIAAFLCRNQDATPDQYNNCVNPIIRNGVTLAQIESYCNDSVRSQPGSFSDNYTTCISVQTEGAANINTGSGVPDNGSGASGGGTSGSSGSGGSTFSGSTGDDDQENTTSAKKPCDSDALFINCEDAEVLCDSDDPSEDCLSKTPIMQYLQRIINFASFLVIPIITAVIVVGGIQYTTATGDSSKVQAAKNRIYNGLWALGAYGLLWTFLEWLIPGGAIG